MRHRLGRERDLKRNDFDLLQHFMGFAPAGDPRPPDLPLLRRAPDFIRSRKQPSRIISAIFQVFPIALLFMAYLETRFRIGFLYE